MFTSYRSVKVFYLESFPPYGMLWILKGITSYLHHILSSSLLPHHYSYLSLATWDYRSNEGLTTSVVPFHTLWILKGITSYLPHICVISCRHHYLIFYIIITHIYHLLLGSNYPRTEATPSSFVWNIKNCWVWGYIIIVVAQVYTKYSSFHSRFKGHFDQHMCLLLLNYIYAYYSNIILNSFSHLLFSKLCRHNLSRPISEPKKYIITVSHDLGCAYSLNVASKDL